MKAVVKVAVAAVTEVVATAVGAVEVIMVATKTVMSVVMREGNGNWVSLMRPACINSQIKVTSE